MTVTTQAELLTAYAAGETSPGLSLLCAAHLSIDSRSAEFVAFAEDVAGQALRRETPQPEAEMDLGAMLARLDESEADRQSETAPCRGEGNKAAALKTAEPPQTAERTEGEANPFPPVLRRFAGAGPADLPWRFRLFGLSEHVLADFEGEKVSLLRARPGSRVPQHTHRGLEATLVLSGALRDDGRLLRRGDISICGAEHDHRPEIVGDETCFCLIVVDDGLRFTGAIGRALNLFDAGRKRGAPGAEG